MEHRISEERRTLSLHKTLYQGKEPQCEGQGSLLHPGIEPGNEPWIPGNL